MREHIHTMSIYDAFRNRDGCPFCALFSKTEKMTLESVLDGECAMDPGVRERTDELGFCKAHLKKMREMQDMLSLALLLESRLKRLDGDLFGSPAASCEAAYKLTDEVVEKSLRSCHICHEIEKTMRLYYDTVLDLWRTDADFKALFQEQRYFCLPHFQSLAGEANKKLRKNEAAALFFTASDMVKRYLESLEEDARRFCKSFDYRYSGMDLGEAKTVIQRTIAFLTGNGEKVWNDGQKEHE
jgi:hypothetical protein